MVGAIHTYVRNIETGKQYSLFSNLHNQASLLITMIQLSLNLKFVRMPFFTCRVCHLWNNSRFPCVLHGKLADTNKLSLHVIRRKLHFIHMTDSPRELACTALTHVYCTACMIGHSHSDLLLYFLIPGEFPSLSIFSSEHVELHAFP